MLMLAVVGKAKGGTVTETWLGAVTTPPCEEGKVREAW